MLKEYLDLVVLLILCKCFFLTQLELKLFSYSVTSVTELFL